MNSTLASIIFDNTVTLSAPLILAALGGYCSERSGVVNIALEGKMLTAACLATVVGAATNNPYLGLLAGMISAIIMAIIHWLMTQTYRVDAVVSGMAINVIALGGTNFLRLVAIDPDRTAKVPYISTNVFYALAFTLPIAVWAYSRWTRGGLRLLAVGSDPDKARTMGVNPLLVRLGSAVGTGIFCGLSGALIASNAGTFSDNMTSGRGYIALAALILGGWRPVQAALACVAFGAVQGLQILLQGSIPVPSQARNALPYLVTIIAIAGFAAKNRAPAGIGKI